MQSTDSRQRKKLQFHNRESVCLPCFFIFNSKSTIASQIFCGWVEERRLRFGALICCHGGSFLSFSGAVYRTFQCEMMDRPSICTPTRSLSGKYFQSMSNAYPGAAPYFSSNWAIDKLSIFIHIIGGVSPQCL